MKEDVFDDMVKEFLNESKVAKEYATQQGCTEEEWNQMRTFQLHSSCEELTESWDCNKCKFFKFCVAGKKNEEIKKTMQGKK